MKDMAGIVALSVFFSLVTGNARLMVIVSITSVIIHMLSCSACRKEAKRLIISRSKE